MSVVADLNAAVQAAITANEAGDLDTAAAKVRTVRLLLASIPDSNGKDTGLRWDRQFIEQLAQNIEAERRRRPSGAAAGARGIRRTNVTYRNPSGCED